MRYPKKDGSLLASGTSSRISNPLLQPLIVYPLVILVGQETKQLIGQQDLLVIFPIFMFGWRTSLRILHLCTCLICSNEFPLPPSFQGWFLKKKKEQQEYPFFFYYYNVILIHWKKLTFAPFKKTIQYFALLPKLIREMPLF